MGRQGLLREFWWGSVSKEPVGKSRRRRRRGRIWRLSENNFNEDLRIGGV
jgi:hypothetical protein